MLLLLGNFIVAENCGAFSNDRLVDIFKYFYMPSQVGESDGNQRPATTVHRAFQLKSNVNLVDQMQLG